MSQSNSCSSVLNTRLTRWYGLFISLALGCSSLQGNSLANRAEDLTEQGHYEDAIEAYQRHIAERAATTHRPEWENPHFYLLRIADLQLRMSMPDRALESCEEAERAGVDPGLLSDRYRTIAIWYEERGDFSSAFDVLKKYRDRDPLLFDAMLDRIGRKLTASERGGPAGTP